jgi:hypothetical protein
MVCISRVRLGWSGRFWCAMGLAAGAVACGADDGASVAYEDGAVASVELAITTVPASTQCIRVTATPASGAATVKSFVVTAGSSSASLAFGKLKPGDYTLTGDAFNVACTSIGSSVGDWSADPIALTMKAGVVSTAKLTFRKNNSLSASANFVNNVLGGSLGDDATFIITDAGVLASGATPGTAAFTRLSFSALDGSVAGNVPTQIAATADGACAARADGTVWCWGRNNYGELGPGIALGATSATPVQVTGLSGVTQLANSPFHVCALSTSGATTTVKCWGYNNHGQLGNGTTTNSSTPVAAVVPDGAKNISCGSYSSYAVTTIGEMAAWGANNYGQLGIGGTFDRTTPSYPGGPGTSPNLAVVAIAGGQSHACSLHADHTVRCWGNNGAGQLADGTTADHELPQLVSGVSARQVIATGWNTCVITVAGQVLCAGSNTWGQIGDGSGAARLTLTAAATPVPLTTLLSGPSSGFACGLTSNSDLYCWGYNSTGQLGDGTYSSAFVPNQSQLQ